MNKIDINCDLCKSFSEYSEIVKVKTLRKMVSNILKALSIDKKEVSLLFCDNKTIKRLNKDFRSKDYPTDVLAFESNEDSYIGDIAISLEKVAEQANKYEVSFEKEMLRLLTHGILHLLGYDHERSNTEKRNMHKLEERVLKEVTKTNIC